MFADYDPKVLPQLLEFSHRYICDVLEDADRYREHRAKAGGGDVKMNKEDFRLAVQATVDFTSQWDNKISKYKLISKRHLMTVCMLTHALSTCAVLRRLGTTTA